MKRFALIGHPVGHSVSPAIHQAAYAALGLDCSYELRDCPDERAVRAVVAELEAGTLAGLNVTVPHKRLALALAAERDPLAEQARAANVLARSAGRVKAYNTDVIALLTELSDIPRGTALVIGNGGAALAAITALSALGFQQVLVSGRRFVQGQPWPDAELLRGLGAVAAEWGGHAWRSAAGTADLVLQATTAGMLGAAPGEAVRDIVPWAELRGDCVAYDVVYNPALTPFLERAAQRGLDARGGLGMLVAQAAAAFELWLEAEAPRREMARAAQAALGGACG